MKLVEFWNRQAIQPQLESLDKVGVVRELVGCLAQDIEEPIEQDEIVRVLLDRERLGSTGIGHGIAIPHGKYPSLNRMYGVFGRSQQGIDFNAIDGAPVFLFFLLLAPESSTGEHLKALARITSLFNRSSLRDQLQQAEHGDAMVNLLLTEDDIL